MLTYCTTHSKNDVNFVVSTESKSYFEYVHNSINNHEFSLHIFRLCGNNKVHVVFGICSTICKHHRPLMIISNTFSQVIIPFLDDFISHTL